MIKQLIGGRPIKEFHKLWRDKLEDTLTVPDPLIDFLEEFDIAVVCEIADQFVPKILSHALTFQGSDQEFAGMIKEQVTNFAQVLMMDLLSGFENKTNVELFVKTNVENVLTECSPPKSAKLITMLGSGPVIKFFMSQLANIEAE